MNTSRQSPGHWDPLRWALRALLVGLVVAACGDVDSSRRPIPTGPATPATPAVTVTRLELSGPGTVHINEAEQFTVVAFRSDGSSADVTAEATWRAFPTSQLEMSAPGRFTGRANGEATISVVFGGRNATKSGVIVVPPGTYRIKGTVRDSGVAVDASVRVQSQPLGTIDIQAFNGQYTVYGVAGETRLTATKSGYEPATRVESIGDHRTVDLDLQLSRSRSDVSGTYTLTITAADSCTTLADDVRSRSYTAAITQSGGELTVTLSGSQFATDHGRTLDQFKGFLEAERAVFRFSSTSDFYYYYFYTPDVLEFLATGRYYGFDGTAVTSLSRDQLAGTLNGTIGTFSGPPFRAALRCRSDNHRFVFSR